MERLDGTSEWNIWMERLNGTSEWNIWMEHLNGVSIYRHNIPWIGPAHPGGFPRQSTAWRLSVSARLAIQSLWQVYWFARWSSPGRLETSSPPAVLPCRGSSPYTHPHAVPSPAMRQKKKLCTFLDQSSWNGRAFRGNHEKNNKDR